ncbi:Uncharacterised protein [Mycobacterium tuberculosis]|nr:Uncharacterised protein [Mycobacterium tuberculosis]
MLITGLTQILILRSRSLRDHRVCLLGILQVFLSDAQAILHVFKITFGNCVFLIELFDSLKILLSLLEGDCRFFYQ